jgi:predicted dehydrogenase
MSLRPAAAAPRQSKPPAWAKARFFQHDSYVSIDYAAQEVEVYRLVRGPGRPAIEGGPLGVAREEPLLGELRDFIDAVRHRRDPLVTGEAGRAALELATRIAAQMAAAT